MGTKHGVARAFIEKAAAYEGDDCLLWPYSKDNLGYGSIWVNGRMEKATREVCAAIIGRPLRKRNDGDEVVMHLCDNPPCVNPRHLVVATRGDNIKDAYDKGRKVAKRGEASTNAKLTEQAVMQMRRLHAEGGASFVELGRRFGVTKATARRAVVGITWAHLPCGKLV